MANAKSQFVGAAGQYYVAYGLSLRLLHATITIGNAMGVDILCSNSDGSRAMSIQVKTQSNAAKNSYRETGFNWYVNPSSAGVFYPNLWYAFVDLRGNNDALAPNVYFVPSKWVGMFVMPSSNTEFWKEKFKRNVERDKKHAKELKTLGWHLIVVWECETTKKHFPPKVLADFVAAYKSKESTYMQEK